MVECLLAEVWCTAERFLRQNRCFFLFFEDRLLRRGIGLGGLYFRFSIMTYVLLPVTFVLAYLVKRLRGVWVSSKFKDSNHAGLNLRTWRQTCLASIGRCLPQCSMFSTERISIRECIRHVTFLRLVGGVVASRLCKRKM